MERTAIASNKVNIVLMPGQTKEDVIHAFKTMNRFSYDKQRGSTPAIAHVNINVTVQNGTLYTDVQLKAIKQ